MHKVWIGCAASNFRKERAGFVPEAIVLHRLDESLRAIDSRCKQPNSFRSAHYAVAQNGDVHQYVEESDIAFHAGIVVAPNWQSLKAGINPNLYTIGLEFEAAANGQMSRDQASSAADLISEIADRWKFSPDSDHLVLHSAIRSGAACPDKDFNSDALLSLLSERQKGTVSANGEFSDIVLIGNANVRQAPTVSSRIVRVAVAGSCERVVGFKDQAERIKGNSCWYYTADGNYIWAGLTNRPNPEGPAKQVIKPPVNSYAPAALTHIDFAPLSDLLNGNQTTCVNEKSHPAAISAVQDLFAGHGYRGIPAIVSKQYGQWTPSTLTAVRLFQRDNGLDETDNVDAKTLRAALNKAPADPRASEAYLALVLQPPASGLTKILSLVAQMEGAGKFAAINPNTDHAGLSFGLIQWAQKPGRLAELLSALCVADGDLFVSIFGEGDGAVSSGLLSHCRKPSGGVDSQIGVTTNAAFNLTEEPWLTRFRQSALEKTFQNAQVQLALQSFSRSYSRIRQFAPDVVSERGTAFLLDVANQFGIGGAARLFSDVSRPGMHEAELLEAIAEETVVRVPDPFKTGVRTRRDHFLETSWLSDSPFNLGSGVQTV